MPQPPGAWPFVGHLHLLLGGERTTLARTLGSMADGCGPIFSLLLGRRPVVVMSSWEAVKDCFTNNDAAIATRPRMAVGKHLGYDYASFSISPHGRYWREVRKLSTVELLSSRRLEALKHVRASEVRHCLKSLYRQRSNNVVCLSKWFEYMTFNIALCTIVGERYSPESYGQRGSVAWRFKKAIGEATLLAGVPVPSDFVPWLEWLDIGGYIASMKRTHREINAIIGGWLDEHIQRRKELGNAEFEDGDFMDVMLSNVEEGYFMSGYSRETIIKATALTLLLTASESTSITLTWAVSLLLNHPEALKKAQQEVNQQVGKQRWAEEQDITNLPHLRAIVMETLRLYPPSPFTGPREAAEDCHVGGHLVKKGSRILVNIWKLHRDPRVWARPDEFRPERFLEETKANEFKGQNYDYIPFSLGRRSCPGMTFGLQVVHLMLARLVQGFDMWTEDGGPVEMSEALGLALPKKGPLDVMLAPRLPTDLYESL